MANNNSKFSGQFVPANFIFDVSQIQDVDVNSAEFKELLVRLYQNINTMCLALNAKDIGLYDINQQSNGQMYFATSTYTSQSSPFVKSTGRQVFRLVLNLPQIAGIALPAGVTTIAHNIFITDVTTFTRIYGVANNTTTHTYYPLPWASAAGATNIEVKVDGTNVTITNNSGIAFQVCYIVLEWITTL